MKLIKLLPLIIISAMLLSLSGCALAGEPGKDGADGLSAYEIAVKYGFEGTEEEWVYSLQGKDAPSTVPVIGDNGNWGTDGKDPGFRAKGNEIINNTLKDPTLEGKNIVCLGDDLFGETTENTSVGYFISQLTGATVTTVSLDGATAAENPDGDLDAFSLYQLADAMTARSYENQKQAAAKLDESYSAAISAIEAIDFNKVDKLVLCFGLNDYLGDVKLGDGESRDTETFRGALAYALEKICSVYTDLQIYLTTPVFCIFDNGSDSDNEKNKCSATLADYAEAVILTARSFKLPAVDNYSNLGINSVNHKYYYSDATPLIPNRNGRELIARSIAKALF